MFVVAKHSEKMKARLVADWREQVISDCSNTLGA